MRKPSKFWIEVFEEEKIDLFVGETSVASFNHDEHGYAGMNAAEKMFEKIAKVVGADFEKRYI